MPGIYIHIPFCKRKCSYCDFYSEANTEKMIPKLINTFIDEFKIRNNYLQNEKISTIYFGGGTPSLLSKSEFSIIFDYIFRHFKIDTNIEITLEANPDDLTEEYLKSIKTLPFNRLSIGIQSFDDIQLLAINRRHTGKDAERAVEQAQKTGFQNISIDLIYGLPKQSVESWKEQLNKAFNLNIQHISAYGLTYEPNTPLWRSMKKGLIRQTSDTKMNEMYQILYKETQENGFDAYEISNFCKPGFISKHNSSYWTQEKYIGIGPSAHSYDKVSRQWNVSSITKYINNIQNRNTFFEIENLTKQDKFNDYVMVSLRTKNGIDLEFIKNEFGISYYNHLVESAQPFIKHLKIQHQNNKLQLTARGVEISNLILVEFIKV